MKRLALIYFTLQAFVDYITLATADEYKHTGITIQTLTPSYVATNMTSFSDVVGKASEYFYHAPHKKCAHFATRVTELNKAQ